MDSSRSSYEAVRDAYESAKLNWPDMIKESRELIKRYVEDLDEFFSDDVASEIIKIKDWKNVFGRMASAAAGVCIRELLKDELQEWDFEEVDGPRKKRKRYYRTS